MKDTFKGFYTLYSMVIKSDKYNHHYLYSCRYRFYPTHKLLEIFENDPQKRMNFSTEALESVIHTWKEVA